MGIATHPPSLLAPTVSAHSRSTQVPAAPLNELNSTTSMSQSHRPGIFGFSNGLRPEPTTAHQIGGEKLREQAFEPPPSVPLVGIGQDGPCGPPEYEATGMLSEMLSFPISGTRAATSDLPEHAVLPSYRVGHIPAPPRLEGEMAGELWYGSRQSGSGSGSSSFLPPVQFPTWLHESSHNLNQENYQGLSLSLSSSLNHLEVPKVEEQLRINNIGDGGLMFYNNNQYAYKSHLGVGPGLFGPSSSTNSTSTQGVMNALRNSRYARAAQELLEEFCSVSNGNGRAQIKRNKFGNTNSNPSLMNSSASGGGLAAGSSSTSSKDLPPLSAPDRAEQQRRKARLLSMLDEVERRYNHYCEQMQMVVNSFDTVMGYGAAVPYTTLAQKAMSRHFRCLKDAIATELKSTCERLGEKDASGSSGITKGETPRLKMLEQSLRQQRAFHQLGMMDQEAWRPQRGLPERSVNILRSWLFEHFLHPYPSDADKLLLSRQTGLSRNQVSNWFINARVRLWKPMVEEMYQQDFKEANAEGETEKAEEAVEAEARAAVGENDPTFPVFNTAHRNYSETQPSHLATTGSTPTPATAARTAAMAHGHYGASATTPGFMESASTSSNLLRSTASGDVSLTLGLHQGSGNGNNMVAEKAHFPVRDFGGLYN
ncbi:BEL1-like homeodomain protein 4 [Punica granatum]|uniref:Homeobox domain-containing protein n=2 Tax=Punica granatum TaxID=22663 RepID=A0A218W1D5_PUNGR|nr:BEL1-like homeodomain protein 4 [Punica granatum]OWM66329.1 hypothetical protein CDL15_Pgr013546 [Punica granatum]PKI41607.1 hypothetical protein CRG98_038007 [Punica granatum]